MLADTGHGAGSWSSDPVGVVITDNTTFTYSFAPNIYTVTYKVVNGTWADGTPADKTETVTYNESPTDVPIGMLANTGYGSGSWSTNPVGAMITEDTTFTYTFTLNIYTVSFDSAGGSTVADITVNHGSKVIKPANPSKTGYSFEDWYTDEDCADLYDFDTLVTSSFTLYAKWQIITYIVEFDSDGGTDVPDETVNYGDKVTEPAEPTKDGYDFDGWYIDGVYSDLYDFNSAVTKAFTIFAKWIATEDVNYDVTFLLRDGDAVYKTSNINEGDTVSEPTPAPTETGYDFVGWYTDEVCTMEYDFETPVIDDLILYSKWQIKTYTVTFDSNGGSAVESQTVDHGSKVIKPVDPSKTGYGFLNWYSDEDCTVLYDFDTPVTSNFTLFAKWALIYLVLFDADGGDPVPDTQLVISGGKASEPPLMNRTGYTFAGWYAEGTLKNLYDFDTPVISNIVIYAKWQSSLVGADPFTITFMDMDGETPIYIRIANDGDKVNAPDPNPTKDGYAFIGWYTDEDCTVEYDFDTPVIDDLTLYSKWQITYTITASAGSNGSIAPSGSVIVVEGANQTFNFIPLSGYEVDTVTVDGTAAPKANSYTFTNVTANHEIHVTFKHATTGGNTGGGTTYYVTFNSDGGSSVPQQAVKAGDKAIKPANPTKEGYLFVNWYTDADCTNLYDFNTTVNGSFTLYAKWIEIGGDGRPAVSDKVKEMLETDAHIRYIYGYPGAPVRPNGAITRAEIAMIFWRLSIDLDKDDELDNIFSDVPEGAWYTQAVKFLAEIGIINGYEDGTFRPNQPITRAEFAKIAAGFDNMSSGADNPFSDLSDTHWAYDYIISCYMKSWINGYPSGEFKPDNNITRAEAIKIVNFMLGRGIKVEDIPEGVISYTDLLKSHWAYNEIIEASVEHEYERIEDNWEIWTDYTN
ncbi:MAG: InlB B-repeat-containing protein [Clostridiales bacterium]|jgi:uncharacterized repeat protein (TIGR02543 family)|nr:InlB B-repeat-containing protein [Clostridiales bacterium]